MLDHSNGGEATEASRSGFFHRILLCSDHKVIGLRYLWLALFSVFLILLRLFASSA